MGRPPGIDEQHALSGLSQMPGGPGAEDAGSHDDHVGASAGGRSRLSTVGLTSVAAAADAIPVSTVRRETLTRLRRPPRLTSGFLGHHCSSLKIAITTGWPSASRARYMPDELKLHAI